MIAFLFQVRHKGTKKVFAMKLLSKFEMVSLFTADLLCVCVCVCDPVV